MDPLTSISTLRTPQTEKADPRQVPNAAGGYGFKLSDESRIHRFLTIGTTGGTYYATERQITKDNAEVVLGAARARGEWLAEQATSISVAGRAPRQNPAIFALATAAALADDAGRKAALGNLSQVCRTGSHLFTFATYVEQFRGWGRGLKRAVGDWYLDKDVNDLAYQAVKYRQREGWTHAALLRLAHPETDDPARRALFNWIINSQVETSRAPGGEFRPVGATSDHLPALVHAFERAQAATTTAAWIELIESGIGLSWEMLPDVALTKPEVWEALIARGLPQTALMRQLPRLTRLGILTGSVLRRVTDQLADVERLRKARVHPVNVLVAARTYAAGRSMQGSSTWAPNGKVIDALDSAFYTAFGNVRAADKRTLVALDVSGSMTTAAAGLPISCREASAALALVTMATEPDTEVVGFCSSARSGFHGGFGDLSHRGLTELSISPRQRLDDAIRTVSNLHFGGTDCSLPMQWAMKNRREFDTFVIYTDSETYAGTPHPHQALKQYRQASGIDARLVVVGMTANDISIADPSDVGMLDVAGFDSAAPQLIADFSRGVI